uniref:RGS domain-containing protein n=1 Tax=Ciona savignyi TaxID=51511 RepID=H2Y592_CIOSA
MNIYRPRSMACLGRNLNSEYDGEFHKTRSGSTSTEGKISISSDGFRSMMKDIQVGLGNKLNKFSSVSDLTGMEFGDFNDVSFVGKRTEKIGGIIGKITKKKKYQFGSVSNISVCSSLSHRVKKLNVSNSASKLRGRFKRSGRQDKSDKLQHKFENIFAWLHRSGKKAGRYAMRRNRSPIPMTKSDTRRKPLKLTLKEVLSKKETTNAFRAFLSRELSEENLDFWLDVETYKRAKASKRQKMGIKIYEKYISPSSTHEINVESCVRQQTRRKLLNFDVDTFDEAQQHIFKLMAADSFRRFLEVF